MKGLVVFAALAFGAFAQQIPLPGPIAPATMPTYVGGYANFNQASSQRWNFGGMAAVPVSNQVGLYSVTAADLTPAVKVGPTGAKLYTLNATVRTGLHKTLYTGTKIQILLGGDLGLGSSATGPLMSITATVAYQINARWAVVMPFRGLYVQPIQAWQVIPELAIVWKP